MGEIGLLLRVGRWGAVGESQAEGGDWHYCIGVSPSPRPCSQPRSLVCGREGGWSRVIVWVRVESGTVVYVSPSLLSHTLSHIVWI